MRFLLNVGTYLPNCTTSHSGGLQSDIIPRFSNLVIQGRVKCIPWKCKKIWDHGVCSYRHSKSSASVWSTFCVW